MSAVDFDPAMPISFANTASGAASPLSPTILRKRLPARDDLAVNAVCAVECLHGFIAACTLRSGAQIVRDRSIKLLDLAGLEPGCSDFLRRWLGPSKLTTTS